MVFRFIFWLVPRYMVMELVTVIDGMFKWVDDYSTEPSLGFLGGMFLVLVGTTVVLLSLLLTPFLWLLFGIHPLRGINIKMFFKRLRYIDTYDDFGYVWMGSIVGVIVVAIIVGTTGAYLLFHSRHLF